MSQSFILSVFQWYEANDRTRPLIESANRDYDTVIEGLDKALSRTDPQKATEDIRAICREYATNLCTYMDMGGKIGRFSQGMVLRDVANASMLLNASFFADTNPPASARVEAAQVLLLQARMQAIMMICAADAGAVFG